MWVLQSVVQAPMSMWVAHNQEQCLSTSRCDPQPKQKLIALLCTVDLWRALEPECTWAIQRKSMTSSKYMLQIGQLKCLQGPQLSMYIIPRLLQHKGKEKARVGEIISPLYSFLTISILYFKTIYQFTFWKLNLRSFYPSPFIILFKYYFRQISKLHNFTSWAVFLYFLTSISLVFT